jgi:hypothetical protein
MRQLEVKAVEIENSDYYMDGDILDKLAKSRLRTDNIRIRIAPIGWKNIAIFVSRFVNWVHAEKQPCRTLNITLCRMHYDVYWELYIERFLSDIIKVYNYIYALINIKKKFFRDSKCQVQPLASRFMLNLVLNIHIWTLKY